MRTTPPFLRALLVAFALMGSTGSALAVPTHHLNLDTSGWAGKTGFIDLYFSRDGGAPASTVTLSNFTGAFDARTDGYGDVNQEQSAYLGAAADLIQFRLVPLGGQSAGGVTTTIYGSVAAVPEPSGLLLMLTGAGLAGFMVRRRDASGAG